MGCDQGQQSGKTAAPPTPEVGVVTLAPQSVAITTELPGRTTPYRVADVRPQVGGVILKRLFTEGAEVKAGQQLYQIDPATFEASYASAQATLARAEATQKSARLKAERYKSLVEASAVGKQDYDDAVAAAGQADADVASGKAGLETARINLVYTKVLAPISGRVGRSSVTEGALVTTGQATSLATVQQLDPIYVDVTQSSTDILRLRRELADGRLQKAADGQAVARLILEDGSEYPEVGKLLFSEVTVDTGTGSVTLRAVFPNPKRLLLPGMFVHARLEEGVSDNTLLVPQQGVSRNQRGEPTALVIGADDKVEMRVLKVDHTIGDKWLVTDGLKAGDRVIVEGLQKVRPGAPVRAVPAGNTAAGQTGAAPSAK
ncbi:efflux RND transporter periplasmic adaptor subunit [Telmatospirillum siberiense]|uniref:Efflux transporter periplasmic adaptor subunit n=1 Tax=Telmatospirillum siberiense TaxID=382514 RepID=A0A2N3PZ94_9PROT|nr:efflux RND transporter periplasmic adaptor subunit [Telmatospirillum siberiense]PKU25699.1 efflux transporter periplasmic adaptor subunit [Telmatospirillum siberiense]